MPRSAETRVDRWTFDADATGRQFTPPRASLPPRLATDADTSKAMARLVLENQELKQKLAEQRKLPLRKDDCEQRLSQAGAREAGLRAELAELKRRFANLESRYNAVKSELAKARRPATTPSAKRDVHCENTRLNEAPPPPPPARPSTPKPSCFLPASKHGGVTMVQGRLHVRAADGTLVALDDWCRRQQQHV